MTDAELLSKLKLLGSGSWICRWSTSGRGIRLHETSPEAGEVYGFDVCASPQEAIAAFLEAEKNRSA